MVNKNIIVLCVLMLLSAASMEAASALSARLTSVSSSADIQAILKEAEDGVKGKKGGPVADRAVYNRVAIAARAKLEQAIRLADKTKEAADRKAQQLAALESKQREEDAKVTAGGAGGAVDIDAKIKADAYKAAAASARAGGTDPHEEAFNALVAEYRKAYDAVAVALAAAEADKIAAESAALEMQRQLEAINNGLDAVGAPAAADIPARVASLTADFEAHLLAVAGPGGAAPVLTGEMKRQAKEIEHLNKAVQKADDAARSAQEALRVAKKDAQKSQEDLKRQIEVLRRQRVATARPPEPAAHADEVANLRKQLAAEKSQRQAESAAAEQAFIALKNQVDLVRTEHARGAQAFAALQQENDRLQQQLAAAHRSPSPTPAVAGSDAVLVRQLRDAQGEIDRLKDELRARTAVPAGGGAGGPAAAPAVAPPVVDDVAVQAAVDSFMAILDAQLLTMDNRVVSSDVRADVIEKCQDAAKQSPDSKITKLEAIVFGLKTVPSLANSKNKNALKVAMKDAIATLIAATTPATGGAGGAAPQPPVNAPVPAADGIPNAPAGVDANVWRTAWSKMDSDLKAFNWTDAQTDFLKKLRFQPADQVKMLMKSAGLSIAASSAASGVAAEGGAGEDLTLPAGLVEVGLKAYAWDLLDKSAKRAAKNEVDADRGREFAILTAAGINREKFETIYPRTKAAKKREWIEKLLEAADQTALHEIAVQLNAALQPPAAPARARASSPVPGRVSPSGSTGPAQKSSQQPQGKPQSLGDLLKAKFAAQRAFADADSDDDSDDY